MCKIKFEFNEFSLAPPSLIPYPACVNDEFEADGISLCGENAGQHSELREFLHELYVLIPKIYSFCDIFGVTCDHSQLTLARSYWDSLTATIVEHKDDSNGL